MEFLVKVYVKHLVKNLKRMISKRKLPKIPIVAKITVVKIVRVIKSNINLQ